MNQEPNLEELFSNYHPTLSDSDAFMQALSRRLDAVQYVERYQAAQAARYRRYIVIALLVGLVLGGVSLAVFLFLAPSAQFFTFRVQSDVLLLIKENSRLIAVLILSLLVSAALFFIFRSISEIGYFREREQRLSANTTAARLRAKPDCCNEDDKFWLADHILPAILDVESPSERLVGSDLPPA